MSLDNNQAGLFHFANPRNYFRNLASYASPNVSVVKPRSREYLTVLDFEPKVILGLSFGNGICNAVLAQAIYDANLHFKNPSLVAQEEIASLYGIMFPEKIKSIPTRSPDGKYRTSRAVFRDAIERFNLKKDIAFVAHPAHMERILVTASQEGLEGIPFTPAQAVWNEEGDKHGWTTSPVKWVARELVLGRTVGSFL